MGNRAYLTINEVQLFESNNALPCFWLMGFSQETIESLEQPLRRFSPTNTAAFPDDEAYFEAIDTAVEKEQFGSLCTPLVDYHEKLVHHKQYIQAVYPRLIRLYEAYLAVIAAELEHSPKEFVELGYIEILDFYEDYLTFYEELATTQVDLLRQRPLGGILDFDLIGTTIGYDDYSNHHGPLVSPETRFSELLQPAAAPKETPTIKEWLLGFFQRRNR